MSHKQITQDERYSIDYYRRQGLCAAQIGRLLGRHATTIARELRRNRHIGTSYYPLIAQAHANGRRSRSRKVGQFSAAEWVLVVGLLEEDWSPEQISLVLRRNGRLKISHETIYQYILRDKRAGGDLYLHLRHSVKRRRKRYNAHDSRGRLAGKRGLEERPEAAKDRTEIGHVEADLVHGTGSRDCILTVIDRKSRRLAIFKLPNKTMAEVNRALIKAIRDFQIKTVTLDNGSEYHDYKRIEMLTGVKFYFAAPYHSWERGTSENANGLIRQYLPKGTSMAHTSQRMCNAISNKLNTRPRKILDLLTPEQAHHVDTMRTT